MLQFYVEKFKISQSSIELIFFQRNESIGKRLEFCLRTNGNFIILICKQGKKNVQKIGLAGDVGKTIAQLSI